MSIQNKLQAIISAAITATVNTLRAATLDEMRGLSATLEAAPQTARAVHTIASKAEVKPANETPRTAKRRKNGRLARRSEAQIAAAITAVTKLLGAGPLRSEHIRKGLNLDVREMPRILREGVEGKHFKILSGEKRSTLYGLSAAKTAVPVKNAVKKPAKKK